MIEIRVSPSGRQVDLQIAENRGLLTYRDINDRAAPVLEGTSPAALLVLIPRMMRAREFEDLINGLPALRAVMASMSRVAIVTNTPPVDWLAQLKDQFSAQELRHFLVADKRRADRWLDAADTHAAETKKATTAEAAAAEAQPSGGRVAEEGGDSAGVYELDSDLDVSGDEEIDDWFVKS